MQTMVVAGLHSLGGGGGGQGVEPLGATRFGPSTGGSPQARALRELGARRVGICHPDDESCLARGVDVTRVVIHCSLLALGHELDAENVARRRMVVAGDSCADCSPRRPRRPSLCWRLGEHVHRVRDGLTRQRVSCVCDSIPLHWACFLVCVEGVRPYQIGEFAAEHKPGGPRHRRAAPPRRSRVRDSRSAFAVTRERAHVELRHGRERNHRRRRGARAARVQPRSRDLPGDRALGRGHQARRSSSTTSPSGTASCARSRGGRRRSSAGRRACTRASSSRPARRAAATPSSRSASRAELRTTCRPRGSSSRRAATPTRSAPRRSPSSAGRPRWARSRFIRGRFAATTSTIRTSCASTSTRSRARTSPTPCASPPRRACCWTSSATPASRRPRAAAASTSTSGSSRAGRSPTFATPRSPSGASSSGACRAR